MDQMAERTIPVVDFGVFVRGAFGEGKEGEEMQKEKEHAARQIDTAFREVGFVYLVNHGVDAQAVGEAFEWSKKFFALPHETKMLAPHPPGGSHHRGYSAPGVEKVSQHEYDANELEKLRDIPDYKESFESGNTSDASQPNIWPPDTALPGFRPFMESFFPQCASLVHRILDALSLALAVPAPGLSPTHAQSLFQLRLLHYPSLAARELREKRRERINAHSDFGTLTLLWQDSVGGLEIEDPSHAGVFRPADPVPNAVLVNIGDLMARWSNDRWRSTVHRVGLPSAASEAEAEIVPERYSIPFFATADPETLIEALPGCWGEGRPKKYEAVTAWGYVQMRMAALYEE